VLVLDADHDPWIGEAVLPVNRRTVIQPRFNAEVVQVRDTACSKRKLLGCEGDAKSLQTAARRRRQLLALATHEAAQGRKVLIGTYKAVADLLRQELTERPIPNVEVAHFGAVRGLDRWKDFDTVIVAGREQMPPQEAENMARCLFGGERERLLLTGSYVPQMRGHRKRDGTRTAVEVQVHPDLRVQAVVEQAREREVEQMVGRLRLVHRPSRARVYLLTNLPTRLTIDRLTTWEKAMPNKLEQAIVRSGGVVPLSSSELARLFPDLWQSANEADLWRRRKGSQFPIEYYYWKLTTLSAFTHVTYRRPGQGRGSPHRAIIPGDVYCPDAAQLDLEQAGFGEMTAVRIIETHHRPSEHERAKNSVDPDGATAHVSPPGKRRPAARSCCARGRYHSCRREQGDRPASSPSSPRYGPLDRRRGCGPGGLRQQAHHWCPPGARTVIDGPGAHGRAMSRLPRGQGA
jgi:hypothetical protein